MATIRKIISGHKSRNNGLRFEAILLHSAFKSGWTAMKLPEGGKQVHRKFIRVPVQFDFIFAKQGTVIFADAKTTIASSYAHSQITRHQVDELLRLEKAGTIAGYIINFETKNEVRFYPASQLDKLKHGESLNDQSGILLGSSSNIDLDLIVKVDSMARCGKTEL